MLSKQHHAETLNSKRMLCVWFPNWPIQRLVVARPELRRQRVILFWQHPQRGQLVAAVSPRAQLDGVCLEMPLSEAKSLVQAGLKSDSEILPLSIESHQPETDRVQLVQLALGCETFSPIIGIERAIDRAAQYTSQPSSIFLDISGIGHLFGNETSLIEQVQSHFESSGYHPVLGVAPTMGLAWALAHFPDCEMNTLPVEALRISSIARDTLAQLGIQNTGQLLQLPRAAIKTRLGETIGQRLDELTGDREEVLNTIRRPAELTANQSLDYPITHLETVEVIIERLVSQLCKQLNSNQRGAIQWQIDLAGPERLPARINVNLFQPAASSLHVMQIFKMQMENSREHSGSGSKAIGYQAAVQDITVSVLRSVLLTERQRELFDENPRLNRQAFAQLINRLASRLGSRNVLQARLMAGAQAEYAARMVPLVGPGADIGTGESFEISSVSQTKQVARKLAGKRKTTLNKPGQPKRPTTHFFPLDRPLRLYERPIELQAVSISDGHPALLIGKQKQLRVTRAWGPERVESGWWRGPTVRRDYWRVETSDGRWLWVYRNLNTRGWFLHGEF